MAVPLAHCREDEVTATCTSSYFFINTIAKKQKLTLPVDVPLPHCREDEVTATCTSSYFFINQHKKKLTLHVVVLDHCREDEVTATCTCSYFFINTTANKKLTHSVAVLVWGPTPQKRREERKTLRTETFMCVCELV